MCAATVEIVGTEATRHSTSDRARVRHGPLSGGSEDGRHEESGGGDRVHDGGDLHPALAAHRTAGEVDPGEPMQRAQPTDSTGASAWWLAEQVPALRQRASTRAIREETEVANAHETAGHDVEEKASEEFVRVERHDLHAVVIGVVPPPESDTAVAVIDEPIIRQRDTMRVPPEVVEHLLGTGERPLRIDDPRRGAEVRHEGREARGVGERRRARGEGEGPSSKARRKPARYLARKTSESAFTGNRNDARPRIHRVRSGPRRRP